MTKVNEKSLSLVIKSFIFDYVDRVLCFAIKFPFLPKQKDYVNREGCPKKNVIAIEMIHFWSMLLDFNSYIACKF